MDHREDGQHRERGTGAPGEERGQRSRLEPGAFVGDASGGERQNAVPPSRRDGDISTEDDGGRRQRDLVRRRGA